MLYILDISMPRQVGVTGEFLPSPRSVSNIVHSQDPCCPMKESDLSLYVMQWGQMMDHDITDTAIAKGRFTITNRPRREKTCLRGFEKARFKPVS